MPLPLLTVTDCGSLRLSLTSVAAFWARARRRRRTGESQPLFPRMRQTLNVELKTVMSSILVTLFTLSTPCGLAENQIRTFSSSFPHLFFARRTEIQRAYNEEDRDREVRRAQAGPTAHSSSILRPARCGTRPVERDPHRSPPAGHLFVSWYPALVDAVATRAVTEWTVGRL